MSGYKYGMSTLLAMGTTSASTRKYTDSFLQGIPDAFINTNTGWSYTDNDIVYVNQPATAGYISSDTAIRTSGTNTWSSNYTHITLFTKSGDQIRDNFDKYADIKTNYTPKINSNYDYIDYTKIILYVDSTNNVSWEKISNGQPIKGWLDPSFVRYIGTGNYSSDILKTYDNGNFIQIADGYLLGWNPSNPSLS